MADNRVDDRRQRLVAANRAEYGDRYSLLAFPDREGRTAATARRAGLLGDLADRVETGCRGSKLDMRRLAPGCRLCTEGAWSCLFINGRCNARCFYCPAPQDETGLPTTNTLTFGSPADYVAYLERFGFRGASFSGGEPLLTPDRTLSYLAAAKRRFGDRLHVWLYTNGTRVDQEILLRLRDAGLDEIRFDIGAVGYALDPALQAVGLVPTVTVEIPAVPEERDRLKGLMAQMADGGIAHLNLHQMRLTPHNLPHLATRPYTFLHGERVTVLESELAALELLCHGFDRGIDLPVNYCSFVYKNRCQHSAARRRAGEAMKRGCEDITAAGYIRSLALTGEAEVLGRAVASLRAGGVPEDAWELARSGDRLFFRASLWPLLDFASCRLQVAYAEAAMREKISYRTAFAEVKLATGRKIAFERWTVKTEAEIGTDQRNRFATLFLQREGEALAAEECGPWQEIHRCEFLPAGLPTYF